ncbi:MAG: homoserine O-succinyltransferase [Gammaproteobacteria bacterium]|nr:homoserine O-succinyltransferase [Gammaproteobacteria bacterium]NNF62413.1 homoserine O-succinyltransferase [Gammaproteobacteria bacterium]NNM21208.1 homoserine O-succinyltransferase [Gammaproteobacteria bacterium]
MPLIAHNDLPSYARLADEGQVVIGDERARHQDIRELHIGLLNMMPDAALEATERQFLRLVGNSNRIAQMYVHLFSVDGLGRGPAARDHIARHYQTFEQIAAAGLDALIITGANITGPDLTRENFYPPMTEVTDWARDSVTSVLCSCLASHAVWRHYHDIERRRLDKKLWGVFEHRTIARDHPIVSGVNTRFEAPHSRYNDVSRSQLEAAGITVLTESETAGVLLAASADGLRFVYVQGHPEYDTASLAKEYKREVNRYRSGERNQYPPYPRNYFDPASRDILEDYRARVLAGCDNGFPDAELDRHLDNTWTDTGKSIFNNWLGLVYQVTGLERNKPFMQGVNAADPLHLDWH